MTPKEWLETNQGKLGSKFERLFVLDVLSRVPDFDFEALQAQMPFTENTCQRYCDFAIKEGTEIRIAMEIDGYDKKGTGTGMTRREFVDWQRREAALVSQGWFVLRFANTDVRDSPDRCARHISLLLRRERKKTSNIRSLRESIAEIELHAGAASTKRERLSGKLLALQGQLAVAEKTQQLNKAEVARLDELNLAQKHIKILERDALTMKTTIWAFTALIGLIIAFLIFRPTGPVVLPQPEHYVPQRPEQGSSCEDPLNWQLAADYVGQFRALSGPVIDVTYRGDVEGRPTWITIGASFPNPKRLTLIIWGENREKFGEGFGIGLEGKTICAFGKVTEYKGRPQIRIQERGQLIGR